MSNEIIKAERAGDVLGVAGRFFNVVADPAFPAIIRNQRFAASRPYKGNDCGPGRIVTVEIRFDDECKNGHNSFAITGHVAKPGRDWDMGGCIHEVIADHFPELVPLIRWHLSSTDGPMHYAANAVYLAGDRDHNGRRKGDAITRTEKRVRFGEFPISFEFKPAFTKHLETLAECGAPGFELIPVAVPYVKRKATDYDFSDKYTIQGFECDEWHKAPFDDHMAALEFCLALASYPLHVDAIKVITGYSEGKTRELDAARRVAVWPEATDEQLCAEPDELRAALAARLPGLIAAMRADITGAGFMWSQE